MHPSSLSLGKDSSQVLGRDDSLDPGFEVLQVSVLVQIGPLPVERLARTDRDIGQLGAGKKRTTHKVDVATIQTLARMPDQAAAFDGYGLVIVDECHHLPAVTFDQAVRRASVRRWLGLTATPYRRDGLEGGF